MIRSLGLIVILSIGSFLFSCEKKPNTKDTKKDSLVTKEPAKEPVLYSGEADKPMNEFQITSAGLGKLILGDSLEKVLLVLQPLTKKIEDDTYIADGKEWPSKKIHLTNGFYIQVSMVNTIDLVTTIHTNDPSYLTKSGIHAGEPIDSLSYPLDSIKSDVEHRAFTIGNDGVWFKVNKKEEKKYFKSAVPSPGSLKGAEIEELFVVCGDC